MYIAWMNRSKNVETLSLTIGEYQQVHFYPFSKNEKLVLTECYDFPVQYEPFLMRLNRCVPLGVAIII